MSKRTSRKRGFGTVTQRKDGRWEGAVTYGYNESGNPKRHRVYGATEAEAAAKLRAILAKLTNGIPIQQDKQTVAEFLDFWMAQHVAGLEPKTRRGYEQIVRLYLKPNIGKIQLTKLTAQQVQAMLRTMTLEGSPGKKPLSPQTVRLTRAALRAALNLAWKWGIVSENVAARTTTPKRQQKEAVYLTVEEADALVTASMNHYVGGLIYLGLVTGMRLGEASGLTWQDVEFEKEQFHVRGQLQRVEGKFVLKSPKSISSRRMYPITEDIHLVLSRQRELQSIWAKEADPDEPFNTLDLCFTTDAGRPLDPKTVDKHLKRLCDAAGVKRVSFHKLRHTCGSHLVADGVPMAVVKQYLGHSQISLTINTYAHMVPAAHKQAADRARKLLGGAIRARNNALPVGEKPA